MKTSALLQRRHRLRGAPRVSLFAFLAVLICTMGALMLLLLAVTREARMQAVRETAAKTAGRQLEVKAARDMTQWRIEQLKKSQQVTQSQLADAWLILGHVEDHARRLHDRIGQLRAAGVELDPADTDGGRQRRVAEDELRRVQGALADARRRLTDAQKRAKQRPHAYAIIPYDGPNQTHRRPIYLECRADAIVLQPEGIDFGESDFAGSLGPGNPLAAALRAVREYLLDHGAFDPRGDGEPYPLLLVRPRGIEAYYVAREAMQWWASDFGYELIEDDWKLHFPAPDLQLAKVVNQAIAQPRAELAAAAMLHARRQAAFASYPGYGGGNADGGNGNFPGGIGGTGGGGPGGGTGLAVGNGNPGGGGTGLALGNANPGGGGTGLALGNGNPGNGGTGLALGNGNPGNGGTGFGLGNGNPGGSGGTGFGLGNGNSGGSGGTGLGMGDGNLGGSGGTGFGLGNGNPGGGGNGFGMGNGNPGSGGPDGLASGGTAAGGSFFGMSQPPSGIVTDGGAQGQSGNPATRPEGYVVGQPVAATDQSPRQPPPGVQPATPLRPGEWRPSQPDEPPPDDKADDKDKHKDLKSLAKTRGRDWGLRDAGRKSTPFTRPIRVDCYADRLVLVPEAGLGSPKVIPLGPRTEGSIDKFVAALWEHMDSWGIAGEGMYWRPVLNVYVAPGAQDRFEDMRILLHGSGFNIERKP